MAESEEHLPESGQVSERNPQINVVSELPGKPFRITMEVPAFLIMLGLSLSGIAVNNIFMYRTCVHALHHEREECRSFLAPDKTNTSKSLETEVQKYLTFVWTVKLLLESIGPAILVFFLGPWSDTYGRKPLIAWSIFGMALSSMLTVVYGTMENLGPWWFILTTIPYCLSGGITIFFAGSLCYVTDICANDDRSLRLTLFGMAVSIGSVIGGVSSSYLLKLIGNVYLLLLASSINVMAYVFTVLCIKESLTGALQGGLSTVLDCLLVKEMIRECLKRRPNNERAQIILLMFANTLSIFIMYGLFTLDYLYVREKLSWTMKEYTIFSASATSISFVGSLFGAGVVQKILPISDLAFAIIGFISMAAEYFIRAFATLNWHMYLGAGVSLFRNLSSPMIRSLISKIIPLEDKAKVYSLMSALDGVCPLISPALYNSVYNTSIVQFPGAIYILSAIICIAGGAMCVCAQYLRWRTPSSPSSSTTPAYQPLEQSQ